jgi:hypothetical protein
MHPHPVTPGPYSSQASTPGVSAARRLIPNPIPKATTFAATRRATKNLGGFDIVISFLRLQRDGVEEAIDSGAEVDTSAAVPKYATLPSFETSHFRREVPVSGGNFPFPERVCL